MLKQQIQSQVEPELLASFRDQHTGYKVHSLAVAYLRHTEGNRFQDSLKLSLALWGLHTLRSACAVQVHCDFLLNSLV